MHVTTADKQASTTNALQNGIAGMRVPMVLAATIPLDGIEGAVPFHTHARYHPFTNLEA